MSNMYPGDVVAVPVGPLEHVGIVSERLVNGRPTILSRSRRRGFAAEESLEVFAQGKPVFHRGYLGRLPREEVVRRARGRLGTPWGLFSANCEHYVHEAHGLRPQSPTLRAVGQGVAVALLACLVVAAAKEA